MIFFILREACCSQDDQIGPLEIQMQFKENVTLEDVIKKIISSKFLQYSSSHNHMIGIANSQKIVEIIFPQEKVIFHINKENMIINLIDENGLRFNFINHVLEANYKNL